MMMMILIIIMTMIYDGVNDDDMLENKSHHCTAPVYKSLRCKSEAKILKEKQKSQPFFPDIL